MFTNEILNELYKNSLRNKLNMNLNNDAQLNNNECNLINSQNSNNTSNDNRSLIELSDYNKLSNNEYNVNLRASQILFIINN